MDGNTKKCLQVNACKVRKGIIEGYPFNCLAMMERASLEAMEKHYFHG